MGATLPWVITALSLFITIGSWFRPLSVPETKIIENGPLEERVLFSAESVDLARNDPPPSNCLAGDGINLYAIDATVRAAVHHELRSNLDTLATKTQEINTSEALDQPIDTVQAEQIQTLTADGLAFVEWLKTAGVADTEDRIEVEDYLSQLDRKHAEEILSAYTMAINNGEIVFQEAQP